jgi:hypothetical protein
MLKLVWLEPGMGSDVRVEGHGIWPGWIQYGALWQTQGRSMSHRFLEPHYSALRGAPEDQYERAFSTLYGIPPAPRSRVEWLGVGQCTPYCRDKVEAKPYLYSVQSGDGMWAICKKFKQNCDPHENCNGWGLLASVNAPWPGTILNGICVLQINPGDQLKIPASWPDPTDYSNIVCPNGKPYDPATGCPSPVVTPTCSSDADCGANQACINGKCVPLCADKTQRIDPATGLCAACPKGQQRDAKDYTKCVPIPVAQAGMNTAGVLLLASGALVAIYMAVTQGGKGLASR